MTKPPLALLAAVLVSAHAFAPVQAEENLGANTPDYAKGVKPILRSRCFACHGGLKQANGLRLDSSKAIREGGSGGSVVEPGDVEGSLIIDAVTGANGRPRMPPEGEPLSAEQIDVLTRWIASGAKMPDEAPPPDPRSHWAYQPPVAKQPPVTPGVTTANPIDAFLAAARHQRGVASTGVADPDMLLRRVHLDLTGLPPSREEVVAFRADSSREAYARVVDRLLASPAYGERWGRHWMDVWRYSDWDGFGAEIRESHPHIWRFRDWIVESLNSDVPYDRMIQLMLAADELEPDNPTAWRATGFLVRNWLRYSRVVWLDSAVEHTSKAFLATTVNCARCHDHMYDPIAQREYYQIRAFFEPHQVRVDDVAGISGGLESYSRVYDADATTPTYVFTRGDDAQPQKDSPVSPAGLSLLNYPIPESQPVALPPAAYYPGSQPIHHAAALADADKAVAEARGKFDQSTAIRSRLPELMQPEVNLLAADQLANWKVESGEWSLSDGKASLSKPAPGSQVIRYVGEVPADFVVTLRWRVTGGEMWKSVGLSWDHQPNGDSQSAYASLYAGGAKAQVSRRVNGQDQYPNEAAAAINADASTELRATIGVVGSMVRMLVHRADNGEKLADIRYAAAPLGAAPRQGLTVWGFDAAAELTQISVRRASSDLLDSPLFERSGISPELAARMSDRDVSIAEGRLTAALARRVAVIARANADRVMYATADATAASQSDAAKAVGQTAVAAERVAALRAADADVTSAAAAIESLRESSSSVGVAPPEAQLAELTKAHEAAVAALANARKAASSQLDENYTRFGSVYSATSTGRRTALARWIADRRNPLTARVAVNHIWMRHFGSPLVSSVFDFGHNGKPPTHPELLDWLAVDLMDHGWSMKRLHRLIVTSDTYRLSSTADSSAVASAASDRENVTLWKFPSRRLEAEAIRDSILAASGRLDRTLGGPELDQHTSDAVLRRSVYFRISKEKRVPFLDLFDQANVSDCYRRAETLAPQQALAASNSPMVRASSRVLAGRLWTAVSETSLQEGTSVAGAEPSATPRSNEAAFVNLAFETILSRSPTSEEQLKCSRFLSEQTTRLAKGAELTSYSTGAAAGVAPASDPAQRAREDLIHVLFNHHEFVTLK